MPEGLRSNMLLLPKASGTSLVLGLIAQATVCTRTTSKQCIERGFEEDTIVSWVLPISETPAPISGS